MLRWPAFLTTLVTFSTLFAFSVATPSWAASTSSTTLDASALPRSFCSAAAPPPGDVVEITDDIATYTGPWPEAMVFAVSRTRIENSAGSLVHQTKLLAPDESLDAPVRGATVIVVADPASGTVVVQGGSSEEMERSSLSPDTSYPGRAVAMRVLTPTSEIWSLISVDGAAKDLDGSRNHSVRPDLARLTSDAGRRSTSDLSVDELLIVVDLSTLAVTVVCRAEVAS